MTDQPSVGAFVIVPCNDLQAALKFWERLGFTRVGGAGEYLLIAGWGCEVHLTQAGDEPWRVKEDSNPFGIFLRTPHVDEIAALA
ncbi:MAG: glyoxalase, partial [Pseudomonadota bacterium]